MPTDNLVDRLRSHAALRSDHMALRFIEGDGVVDELTFAALDDRIRSLAAYLQQHDGAAERAIILLPSGINYAVAFYACLYAGVIAVPAYPPEGGADRYADRLNGILHDATPRFILTETRLREPIETALGGIGGVSVITVDALPGDLSAEWRETSVRSDSIAFLQYTSGSTSQPKGVCVSHGNLFANEVAMQSLFSGTPDDAFVSWLPLYHDMGLMGGLLNPLFSGFTAVLMSPRNFLERPRRWLEAIDRYGGTISGGPDFAFSLCAERISDEAIARLDLSRWRFAFSGSEFVRRTTLERFAERFKPTGFDRRALTACYGLAEATLLVTGADSVTETVSYTLDPAALSAGRAVKAAKGTDLVSCGWPRADHAVRIMRTDASSEADADEIGEIWVAGPSIAQGYWNNQEATDKTFVMRDGLCWLRTGDLGFLREGALVVTGRLKDLLIVRGQNVYPTDIEGTVEAEVSSVRRSRVAAFPVEIDGREGIGIAAEFSRTMLKRVPAETLAHELGEAVVRQAQEYPAVIVLLNPQGMPLTTSGKLQRSACSAGWANRTLDSFAVFEKGRRRDVAPAQAQPTAAPSTATERVLAAIWQDLLDAPAVGRNDDFFALGGNSIIAAQIAGVVRDRLNVELALRSFFEMPTLASLAAHIESRAGERQEPVLPPIAIALPEARRILSYAQERLWFLWNMDPASTAYTVACSIRLSGALDQTRFARAMTALVGRHETLRTTFVAKDGRGTAMVHLTMDLPITHDDLRGRSSDDQIRNVAERTRTELAKPFDLTNGPLLHAVLVQIADDWHELILTAHHIVADGQSLNVLLEELAGLYRDDVELPPAPQIQYADFAAWQRNWLAGGEADRQLAFWREQLGDTHPILALPLDRPRSATQSHAGDTIGFEIDVALAVRLRAVAGQHRASMFMLMLAVYQLLLFRYTGQNDLRVGVPVAGRRHSQLDRLIGCFVNTLVLRAELSERMTFPELLAQVREAAILALSHQDLPFETLVDALRPTRSGGYNPLFQAKFNYMTVPRGFDGVDGLSADTRIIDLAGSHFDIALDILDGAAGMMGTINYATDLFDRETIARISAQFVSLLRQIVDDADRALFDFAIDDANRQTVARETAAFASTDVLSLFRAAASERPDAIALREGPQEITFEALERRSNQIARRLLSKGVKRESPVTIWIERSPSFVVALLGVLKAGAAYVPLDPKWPVERIRRIVADGKIDMLVAAGGRLADARALDCDVLDAEQEVVFEVASAAPPDIAIHPAQAAYVIYTSGSSGAPKGVVVSHQALANYVQALLQRLRPAPGSSMAMVSTVAADLGHTVLFGALASGATLNLLPPDAAFDAEAFARAMRGSDVGVLKIVPSHLRGLLQAHRSAELLPRDVLILGGEACDPALVKDVRCLRPHCRIVNHYGPTETTVGAVTHECGTDSAATIPIGLPLANLRVHVLDGELNEVPVGVTGKLYIGGIGLARGYRGAPHLTAERFIPDPFGPAGERLYRTGDQARCDQAGRLVFLGRSDDQIKLRGYRIEPGEVVRALKSLPDIADAVVMARALEQERQELVAYCVPASGKAPQPDAIKQRLAALVPDYMVPSRVAILDRLPLTANGKLDRAALPQPDVNSPGSQAAPPVGEVEQAIAAVWQEVLGRPQIGRHDNFFELGGDSILSLQIIARLRKRGIRLTPKQVFAQQTVAALAGVAVTSDAPSAKPTAPAAARPTRAEPLLPIQLRFFAEDVGNRDHFNQALLLVPREAMDLAVLQRALAAVVDHHQALRLRFVQNDGEWQAQAGSTPPASELLWVRTGVEPAEVTAIASTAQTSLSLSSGPLLRAVGMTLADGSQRLLIAIHHLVVDGVSWRILLEDIASAYDQLMHNAATVALPPQRDSVASWTERLRRYASSAELATELPFWLACDGAEQLPCDDDHGGIDLVGDSDEVALIFDAGMTSRLLNEAPAAYRTQVNDLLLAGLARTIWRFSGRADVLVELEGHGREDIFPEADVSRTVGWLTSAFPVRLDDGAADDAALITSVKERLRAVPNHGLGYGVLRYLGAAQHHDALARAARPQVVFNYLGQFDGSFGEALPFRLAVESPGPMRSATSPLRGWLNINGEVRDGCLRLSFGYGRRRYRQETIERLARLYQLSLRELVEHCTGGARGVTPSDFPLSGLGQTDLDGLGDALDWRNVENIYPLSPMQEGMLFHALRDGENDAYVNQVAIELFGIDPERLQAAWQAVSDRHAVLRSGVVWQHLTGAPQQVVYRQLKVPFVVDDWRGTNPAGLDAALAEAARQELQAGFDLSQPPLQRVRLIRLDDARLWLIWTHHHIVLDGWSSARLLAEIMQHASSDALPAIQGSYRDYIAWLQGRDPQQSAAFWREALGAIEVPTLLADAPSSDGASDDARRLARAAFMLEPDLTQRLRSFAKRERVTLNTIMQGAWAQVLRQRTGQNTVCFGVTVSGRPAELAAAEEIVGLFINTLPVVDAPNPQATVGAWLRGLQEQNLAAREHEATPLYEIQRLTGHTGRALFDSILVFENYPIDQILLGKGAVQIGRVEHVTPTNYPLAVAVFDGADMLKLDFNYDGARFYPDQIDRLWHALHGLLAQITVDAEQQIGNFGSASKEEAAQVLEWSEPDASPNPPSLSSHRDVVTEIERQAAQSPAAIAIICGDAQLSYGELNARANALAHRLRNAGISPDRLVGVALNRSPEAIVTLLAVLKTGGAYLPLDPGYPAERLVYMLRDSTASLVVTDDATFTRLAPVFEQASVMVWRLDASDPPLNGESNDLGLAYHPDSLAYVIYTSGSTGRPKGVAVTRGPLAMHCDAIGRLYGMTATDRELHTASINFDIAHERWLVPLMAGGSIVLPQTRDLVIDEVVAEIDAKAVSVLFAPPAYADQLSQALCERGRRLSLRLCIVGGEAWPETGVKALREAADVARLVNAYGPTETVIAPMAWMVDETELTSGSYAPIGRPVGLRSVYILDDNLNVVPAGAVGELFIGGAGLARGYLNRSGLTADRFIPDPFGGHGARLYRTGDLVRWRADGTIDYVGRADQQVKIRGFRIELSEIEARLRELAGVRSAAATTTESGAGAQLIGYVTGDAGLEGAALRSALLRLLPDYMVPPRIIVLEQMPLTPNGKIDRRRLPTLVQDAGHRRYVPPKGDIESTLAKIWAELLGLDRVGRDDHFFELGGHSLLAVRLLSRLLHELGVSVQLSELFRHPELAEFARVVSIALIEREFDDDELQDLIAAEQ